MEVQAPYTRGDVSDRWNDYVRTSECGGRFAYVLGYEPGVGEDSGEYERNKDYVGYETGREKQIPIVNDECGGFGHSSERCIHTKEHQERSEKLGNRRWSRL